VTKGTLGGLHRLRRTMGLKSLDSVILSLIGEHDSRSVPLSERLYPRLAERLERLDLGVSAVVVGEQKLLEASVRLERGAISYNIEMGNRLADAMAELHPVKGGKK
jgi:hypothetical protein